MFYDESMFEIKSTCATMNQFHDDQVKERERLFKLYDRKLITSEEFEINFQEINEQDSSYLETARVLDELYFFCVRNATPKNESNNEYLLELKLENTILKLQYTAHKAKYENDSKFNFRTAEYQYSILKGLYETITSEVE